MGSAGGAAPTSARLCRLTRSFLESLRGLDLPCSAALTNAPPVTELQLDETESWACTRACSRAFSAIRCAIILPRSSMLSSTASCCLSGDGVRSLHAQGLPASEGWPPSSNSLSSSSDTKQPQKGSTFVGVVLPEELEE